MEILVIIAVSFFSAGLTFFSGFGLGTILTPVFMLFFPVDLAIALTGVVHFLNNIFKFFLVGKGADKQVLIRFGIPAVFAALAGAWLLLQIPDAKPLFQYTLGDRIISVYPVKLLISVLLILFALLDLIPWLQRLEFNRNQLPLGGLLSGFFGGLSGNQGALRSAFLIRAGLSKESFIGTAVVLSVFVDFSRLSVYATRWSLSAIWKEGAIVLAATGAAFAGAFLGNRLLKKVTLKFVQVFVAVGLLLLGLLLGSGII